MLISIERSHSGGVLRAPSSKSYTIRGLMCAALAEEESELWYPLKSDDTEAALRVLQQIGVRVRLGDDKWRITGGRFSATEGDLFCGDSAATLRFMSAICAVVPGICRLTAGPSLSKRPVIALVKALQQWGVNISCTGDYAPVTVNGGQFRGGLTDLPGNISSQYVSALLLLAPLARKKSYIWLTSPLESRSYVLMTIQCLRQFGINVRYSDELMEYEVLPQSYKPVKYKIEGDWSSVSYLLGLGAVSGEVKIDNLNPLSLQGDKAIVDFLNEMGASVKVTGETVQVTESKLKGLNADLNDCIDLLPTLSVMAALAQGKSEFTGIRRARLKESDRIASVKEGLEKAGIQVTEEPDKLIITGGNPHEAVIDSKNDHRIAMAFSLLGVVGGGITIEGAECVSKTYPDYWNTLRSLGVKINER